MTNKKLHQLIERLSLPGLLLRHTKRTTKSYLGGMPPADFTGEWPRWKGRPLAFLACIHLANVSKELPWLPKQGKLLFFCDLKDTPWGFDPADLGGWRVIHLTADGSEGFASPPATLPKKRRLPMKHLRFEKANLPPPSRHPSLNHVEFTFSQEEWLDEHLQSLVGPNPAHQMSSHAQAIQNAEMELECQLASNGIYVGEPSGYEDPRAEGLAAGASDWRLLLQVDSDEELDLMWCDSGKVYFWIREEDARSGDFSRTWMILQCF
ncbi:YwqG family protein [Luteolibacter flavescens]|uniref:YwqG family protein n=1 Tax=Luteolibacter flavescens TaxID=1859460 RepID=A0ABT3FNU3_9BACT|nr:YwqG family protein [Luteolibacter flavescens]MCW1884916.1 YwqG family protein [Luteolibacter flavescens]